ncbi:MAG: hypothetical protein QOE55_2208 [Acidobacteriaceae bacterium]|nr:hypothetical protein [Acidobacteriaceae bacterium]
MNELGHILPARRWIGIATPVWLFSSQVAGRIVSTPPAYPNSLSRLSVCCGEALRLGNSADDFCYQLENIRLVGDEHIVVLVGEDDYMGLRYA